jgi:hypothetical protein
MRDSTKSSSVVWHNRKFINETYLDWFYSWLTICSLARKVFFFLTNYCSLGFCVVEFVFSYCGRRTLLLLLLHRRSGMTTVWSCVQLLYLFLFHSCAKMDTESFTGSSAWAVCIEESFSSYIFFLGKKVHNSISSASRRQLQRVNELYST